MGMGTKGLSSPARIVDAAYRGNARYKIADERLFMKKPRRDGQRAWIEEWLVEVVAHRIGLRLGIPVPDTAVKRDADGDLCLSSAFHSEYNLQQTPPDVRPKIENLPDLPGLFVFDQLIYNTDRREDHVQLTGDPRGAGPVRWYPIDHGHSLHGPTGDGITKEMAASLAASFVPPHINYQFNAFGQLEPWIERVSALPDKEIEAIVDEAASGIVAMGVPVDVRVRLEFRAEVLKEFLKRRRDALPRLMRAWAVKSGLPGAS